MKESEQEVQIERLPGLGRERRVGREESGYVLESYVHTTPALTQTKSFPQRE